MRPLGYVFVFSSLSLSTLAMAKTKGVKPIAAVCASVQSCVDQVSKLTAKSYTASKKLKGEVWQSANFKLTKENADTYLSEVLNEHGYTRIRVSDDRYKIVEARDVRYIPTKMLNGNREKVPMTDDYMMVSYTFKDPELSSEIARSFRPFMSRYGRIIDVKSAGKLLLQDTGRNINRLIRLIRDVDKIPTEEELEKRQENRKRHFELEKLRAKHCPLPPKGK